MLLTLSLYTMVFRFQNKNRNKTILALLKIPIFCHYWVHSGCYDHTMSHIMGQVIMMQLEQCLVQLEISRWYSGETHILRENKGCNMREWHLCVHWFTDDLRNNHINSYCQLKVHIILNGMWIKWKIKSRYLYIYWKSYIIERFPV